MSDSRILNPDTGHLRYQPALDGVRALAVVAVLLFHGEIAGFDGGYLGVSVFFTLSGYLITSLLLNEHHQHGRIDLPGFYGRRLRRLMPASIVCLAAIGVIALASDVFEQVTTLRAHIVGALLQVANWVFLAGEGSYEDIFAAQAGAVSPIEHFWSLAIEEQFYWMWPPVMWLLMKRTGGRPLAWVGALTVVFSLAAPFTAVVFGADAAYWATPARIAEILMGAVVAVWLPRLNVQQWWAWLTPLALLTIGACVVLFPTSGGPAYSGYLPLFAVASAALVVGLQADGPIKQVLSLPPLVGLGKISYGVYLFHWPVFVIADAGRVGVDGIGLFAIRCAITMAVSLASYYLIERPIRYPRRKVGARPTIATAFGATIVAVVATFVVVPGASADYWEVDRELAEQGGIDTDEPVGALLPATNEPAGTAPPVTTVTPPSVMSSTPAASSTTASTAPDAMAPGSSTPTSTPPPATSIAGATAPVTVPATNASAPPAPTTAAPTTVPPSTTLPDLARPVRVLVVGDSTARATAKGLFAWAAAEPEIAQIEEFASPGCGFMSQGEYRVGTEWKDYPDGCELRSVEEIPETIGDLQPDVVMAMVTTWDVVDRRWDGGEALTPVDQLYEDRLLFEYQAFTDRVLGAGAPKMVWVKPPVPQNWWDVDNNGSYVAANHDVLGEVLDQLAASRPDRVDVVDLRTWLTEQGLDESHEARPDGTHWSDELGVRIATEFLGPQLVLAAVGGAT